MKDEKGYVLFTDEIDYVEELQYLSEISFKQGFLTKNIRWEYEHEKRILYFERDGVAASHPEVKLPAGCLKEVYIGLRCEKEWEIYDALKDKPEVKVFKIKISQSDVYSLEAVELDKTTWKLKAKKQPEKEYAIKRVYHCLKKSIMNDCPALK